MPSEINLLRQQGGARAPIFGAVVRIGPARRSGELGGGFQRGHRKLLGL